MAVFSEKYIYIVYELKNVNDRGEEPTQNKRARKMHASTIRHRVTNNKQRCRSKPSSICRALIISGAENA